MSEAPHVYAGISLVQGELAKVGISKDQKGHNFMFRGIDQVYNALAPALVNHGLVVLPKAVSREVCERQSSRGGTLIYVTVCVEYTFVAVSDGSQHTVTVYGEAMDSGDKATNKALSAAYKYAMFQSLCIPTEAVDADSETHEVVEQTIRAEQVEQVRASMETLKISDDAVLERFRLAKIEDMTVTQFAQFTKIVAKQSEAVA